MTTDTTETVVEAATSTSVAVVTPKITQTYVAGQRATRHQPAAWDVRGSTMQLESAGSASQSQSRASLHLSRTAQP